MKMTAQEILDMYNQNRSRETMEKIAALNDCTIKEVGEFLKNAASQPKKKPGRPKKDKSEVSNLSSSEDTLKDKAEEESIKVELPSDKKPRRSYLIPELVVEATKEKIREYKRMAEFHEKKMEEYNLQVGELEDFLRGGFCHGEEDGLFREV